MKKITWIIAVGFVLIVGVSWFFALAFPPDPNIATYSEKMSEAYWMDPVHVQESITTKSGSEEPNTYYLETWMSRDYYYRIQSSSSGEKITQSRWNKEEYLNSSLKNGSMNGAQTITAIDFTYYRVSDWGKVTYEETEDQRVFHFQNKALPERYEKRTLGNPPRRAYSEASSVAVFTKDWILQSLSVTERWQEIQSDGTRLPMEKNCHADYLPCTQASFLEDIEKVVWGYRPNFPPIENPA